MRLRKTLRDDPETAEKLRGRIRSVSIVNDLIAKSEELVVDLELLIREKLAAFDRVEILGPPLQLRANTARSLSLVLHELCTNAVKYGGLSTREGTVRVRWQAEQCVLNLIWQESGGPHVRPPTRKGFGSELLDGLFARMGGRYEAEYLPTGLMMRLIVPLD